jgi:hypothetical protein
MALLAEADRPDKAVPVIMADDHQNGPAEVNAEGVQAALDWIRAKGWEVVFPGADFARFAGAQSLGMMKNKVTAMSTGPFAAALSKLARKSRGCLADAAQGVQFGAEDRREAGEEPVERRKGS